MTLLGQMGELRRATTYRHSLHLGSAALSTGLEQEEVLGSRGVVCEISVCVRGLCGGTSICVGRVAVSVSSVCIVCAVWVRVWVL